MVKRVERVSQRRHFIPDSFKPRHYLSVGHVLSVSAVPYADALRRR